MVPEWLNTMDPTDSIQVKIYLSSFLSDCWPLFQKYRVMNLIIFHDLSLSWSFNFPNSFNSLHSRNTTSNISIFSWHCTLISNTCDHLRVFWDTDASISHEDEVRRSPKCFSLGQHVYIPSRLANKWKPSSLNGSWIKKITR